MNLSIYTDGSASPNPGPGGWAAVIVMVPETEIVLRGSESKTTNNRMELYAPLAALDWMHRHGYTKATIFSDSQYAIGCLSQWCHSWARKGWNVKKQNLDLIQWAFDLTKGLELSWRWVRGHNGHHWNERADREAEEARSKRIQHTGIPLRLRELFEIA